MQPRVIHLHEGLTPLQARELNLHTVIDALGRAGVDYFAVRGMDDRVGVIGVPERCRAAVFDALSRRCRDVPGYVSTILPGHSVGDPLMPADDRKCWRKLDTSEVIRVTWFRAEPTRNLILDFAYGCDIEFWKPHETREGLLCSPRHNRMSRLVSADAAPVQLSGERFTRLANPHRPSLKPVRSHPEFDHDLPDQIDFPIDVVYTWVDGMDPAWQHSRAEAVGETYHEESAHISRFISRDELRYSLRSLHLFAPWVNNIYIVTDDQTPSWLNTDHPNVSVVSHKDIFGDPGVLPTFNSHAIESQLHHIDGLTEHFLYFNDDMFLGRSVTPNQFFLANGLSRFYYAQGRVPVVPVLETDTPVDAALKNNRRLIQQRFGRTITQVFEHVPYPLRRSVLREMEQTFPDEYARTMASRFRSPTDISIPSSLHHYYAFHTGRAVASPLRYGYLRLAVPDLADRLTRALTRRDWDAFCLNDTMSDEDDLEAQIAVVQPFLRAYFPVASPYEKP